MDLYNNIFFVYFIPFQDKTLFQCHQGLQVYFNSDSDNSILPLTLH